MLEQCHVFVPVGVALCFYSFLCGDLPLFRWGRYLNKLTPLVYHPMCPQSITGPGDQLSEEACNELGRDVMIRIPSNCGLHIGLDPSFDSVNIQKLRLEVLKNSELFLEDITFISNFKLQKYTPSQTSKIHLKLQYYFKLNI